MGVTSIGMTPVLWFVAAVGSYDTTSPDTTCAMERMGVYGKFCDNSGNNSTEADCRALAANEANFQVVAGGYYPHRCSTNGFGYYYYDTNQILNETSNDQLYAVCCKPPPPIIPHLVYLTGGSNRITGQDPVWSERVGTLTLDVTNTNSAGQCRFNELVPFIETRSNHGGAAVVPYGNDQYALCMVGGIDNTSSDLLNYACNGIEPALPTVFNTPIPYTGPAKDLAVATYRAAADNSTYVCRAGGVESTTPLPNATLACQLVGSGSTNSWTVALNYFPISYGNTLHIINPVATDVIAVFIIGGAFPDTNGLADCIGKYHVNLTSKALMYSEIYTEPTLNACWADNIHGEQTGVAYHGSVIAHDVLYVAGGCAGTFVTNCSCSNQVITYNTDLRFADDNKVVLSPMNTNRCGLDLLFAPEQNRLFAVGGYTIHTDFPGDTSLDTIEYYDIGGTGQWNEITCFPSGLQNIQHFSAVWAVDGGIPTVNPPSPIPCVITDANVFDLAQCIARGYVNGTLCPPECTNASQWDTSLVTSFFNDAGFTGGFASLDISHQNINGWDVSSVTDFSEAFDGTVLSADINLGAWNMSAVQSIYGMFQESNFEGNGIESWDVSNVKDMSIAFLSCNLSASLDLGQWNVGSVQRSESQGFYGTFSGNVHYAGVSLNSWNVHNSVFDQLSIQYPPSDVSLMLANTAVTFVPDWVPTDNATLWELIVREMFGISATGPFNFPDGTAIPPLSGKCVITDSNVLVLDLAQCLARDYVNAALCSPECTNASQWDTLLVTELIQSFADLDISDQNIDGWDLSSVTDFSGAFDTTVLSADINLAAWNMSAAQSIEGMFFNSNFEGNGIEQWDVSNVGDMENAFLGCNLPATLDLGDWDVSQTYRFTGAFWNNPNYKGVGINKWQIGVDNLLWPDTGITSTDSMFTNTAVTFVPDWVPTDNATLWEIIVREMFGINATGPFNFPDGTAIPAMIPSTASTASTASTTPTTASTASKLPFFGAPSEKEKATTVSRLYFLLFLLIIPAMVAYGYSIKSTRAARSTSFLGGPKNVVYHGLLEP